MRTNRPKLIMLSRAQAETSKLLLNKELRLIQKVMAGRTCYRSTNKDQLKKVEMAR